jgi:hypothetical protein
MASLPSTMLQPEDKNHFRQLSFKKVFDEIFPNFGVKTQPMTMDAQKNFFKINPALRTLKLIIPKLWY